MTARSIRILRTAVLVQGVDDEIGQIRAGAFVLEVDHGNVRVRKMLHVFGGCVQHVVDDQIRLEGQNILPEFILLDAGSVVAGRNAGGGQLAFSGADEGDPVMGNFMGQHQGTEHMPHADGRIAGDHEDYMPPGEQTFAQPPVLIAVDLHGPVIEKIGDGTADLTCFQRPGPENDQRLAFHDQFGLVLRKQAFKASLPNFPDSVAYVFYRDQTVGLVFKKSVVGVVDVHPGQERAAGR